MCKDKSEENIERLEIVLIEICTIYQSIVVDIDGALSAISTILKSSGCTNGSCDSAANLIVEVKSKYLPRLVKVRVLTETILNSVEIDIEEINSIIH